VGFGEVADTAGELAGRRDQGEVGEHGFELGAGGCWR
jgi:hypothetical protein